MLEIRNISKSFPIGMTGKVAALDNVSLTIEKGEVISIIGSNGSGKTSLLNAIAGCLSLDCGEILIDGIFLTEMSLKKRGNLIGRVFQNPAQGTADYLTVEENLLLSALRGRVPRLVLLKDREKKYKVTELLNNMGGELTAKRTQAVRLLSGGQRQVLSLLMAVVGKPKILLLDEHTASLDPQAVIEVLDLTKRIVCNGNLSLLCVTHSLNQAISFGNRLLIFHKGRIIKDIRNKEKEALSVQDLQKFFVNKDYIT